jgi:PAS domain S-box-containing protein
VGAEDRSEGMAKDRNAMDPAFFESVVRSSDDAVISKDLGGIILSWNEGAERIYGYTAEEMIGRHISTLTPEDRADEIPKILERLARGDRIDHYETKRRRKDGAIIEVSVTISPIRNESGDVIGASAVARDISPRKRAEEERRRTAIELNDEIVQGLSTAYYALELREHDKVEQALISTLEGAKRIVGRLLEDESPEAFTLRRRSSD